MSRTRGIIRDRSRAAGARLWASTLVLGLAVVIGTRAIRPELWSEFASRKLSLAFLALTLAATAVILFGYRRSRDGLAFAGSCLLIISLLGARAAASFPVLLHSTLDPRRSVSAYDAASPRRSLAIALVWWLVAAPLAFTWHLLASRRFRGRIDSDPLVPT